MPAARPHDLNGHRPIPLDVAQLRRAADRLTRSDRGLRDIHKRLGPPPLWKRPATFATFVRIILEQQVSLASAKSTFDRLRKACRGKVIAVNVSELGEEKLRALGVTRQKTRYIQGARRRRPRRSLLHRPPETSVG